jgi:opacity protein-like surface antigen
MSSSLKTFGKAMALALSLGALHAHAESGLYLGGSFGNAKVGYNPSSNIDVKDDDVGYKLFGGIKFTLLAAEVGYVDFGKVEDSGFSGEISGFNAFGILSMGLGPIDVFGKLGGFVWESDFETAQQRYKDDGFDPAVGVGASVTLGNLSVRAEYEYYDIDNFDNVSMFSIGAAYWLF